MTDVIAKVMPRSYTNYDIVKLMSRNSMTHGVGYIIQSNYVS